MVLAIEQEASFPPINQLQCFKDFESLRYLDVPYAMTIGNEDGSKIMQMFPPSLEFLTLRFTQEVDMEDWTAMDRIIEKVSDAVCHAYREELFPNLRAVELMLRHERSSRNPDYFSVPSFNIEHTRSFLRNHGVHFDVSICYDYHEGSLESPNSTKSPQSFVQAGIPLHQSSN